MSKFIQLNRKFSLFYSSDDNPEQNWDFLLSNTTGSNLLSWNDLLEKDIAIILAEAGTGKTEELKAITSNLKEKGESAFFCRIEMLVDLDFITALDIGDEQSFENWKLSSDTAYFFLDSVDEAKLQNPKNFEVALRKFVNHIGIENLSRAKIYVTSRFTEWRSTTDLQKFCQIFQIPLPEITENNFCYKLEPLDDNQISTFSSSYDIESPQDFLDEIERTDVKIFASRPQDLLDLIIYWKDHSNKLGRYIEMLEYNIQQKLKENNPDRKALLSPEKAFEGVQRVAAAATFTRKNKIRLSSCTSDSELLTISFDPHVVLFDWNEERLMALLSLPLFDEAIYDSVRFHHRSVREFLTAKWILDLLNSGGSRRKIESLLFATQYGREVAIPSMQPISAWLACRDEKIRNKLLKFAPEVLLEYGDPSEFPVEFRIKLLNSIIKQYKGQHRTDLQVDPALIKRLSSPEMSDVINKHLQEQSKNHDLSRLLLKMIWYGKIVDCIDVSIEIALNNKLDRYVRSTALQAVLAVGERSQKLQLVKQLIAQRDYGRKVLRHAICKLFPDLLSVDELVLIIQTFPKKRGTIGFDYYLEHLFKTKDFNDEIILDFLEKILPLVHQAPFCRDYGNCDISKGYAWVLVPSILLANKIIERNNTEYSNPVIQEIFLSYLDISLSSSGHLGYSSTKEQVNKILSNLDRNFSYQLFWKTIEEKKDYSGEPFTIWGQASYTLNYQWEPLLKDWEVLSKEIIQRKASNEKHVAFSALYHIYNEYDKSETRLLKLRNLVNSFPKLAKSLENWINPPPPTKEELKWKKQDEKYRKKRKKSARKEEKRKKDWKQHIQKNFIKLLKAGEPETDTIYRETNYLYNWLCNNHEHTFSASVDGALTLSLLKEEFGKDVANNFQQGCISYWREYDPYNYPEVRSNNVPYARSISLLGLSMEASSNPSWLTKLSTVEVERAVSIAIFELNEFPDWFLLLQSQFSDEVKRTLLKEIEYELSPNCHDSYPHILSRIHHSTDFNTKYYIEEFLTLLENNENAKHESTSYVLINILDNELLPETKERLTKISLERLISGTGLNNAIMWLKILLFINAKVAVRILKAWLAQLPSENSRQDVVIRLFSEIGEDSRPEFQVSSPDYKRTEILQYLVPIAYQYIRVEDDLHHEGTYSPGARDDAQRTRGTLLNIISSIPSKNTYDLLSNWAIETKNQGQSDYLLRLAKYRAETDAEFTQWHEEDIPSFENSSEINPKSEKNLFSLVNSRIYDLKDDYEKADNSIAQTVLKIKKETELRNFLHREFEKASNGKYTIAQEEEYADGKRTDIRFHLPLISPIPVELKIADNWSFNEFHERLENQLIKQYMKVSKYGVFLLVYRGKKIHWQDSEGQKYNFFELTNILNNYAQGLVEQYATVEGIEVIGIDLTLRDTESAVRM